MYRLKKYLASIPKDKLLHALYGLVIFDVLVAIGILHFVVYGIIVFIAFFIEFVDKVTKEGNSDILDFVATISIPTVLMIIWCVKIWTS